ncbi:hypothetical protein ABH935_005987 [Catenulispora sp. GAS73]|uniref:hypothetical protein n=1 Tax=Catenulispora sp. GAS73 TaxID=3156269 RepID=UPI0035129D46
MPISSNIAAAQHSHYPLTSTACLLAFATLYVAAAGILTLVLGALHERRPGRIFCRIPGLSSSIERRAKGRADKATENMDAAGITVGRRPTPARLTDIYAWQYFGMLGSFTLWVPAVLLTCTAYLSAPPRAGRTNTGVELATLILTAAIGTLLVADQVMAARSAPHNYAVTSSLAVIATLAHGVGNVQRSPYEKRVTYILTTQIERLCGNVTAVSRANVSTRDVEFRRLLDAEAGRLISTLHARKRHVMLSKTPSDRTRLANVIGSFASYCATPTNDVVGVRLVDPRLLDRETGSSPAGGATDRLRVVIPALFSIAAVVLAVWAAAQHFQVPSEVWMFITTGAVTACGWVFKSAGVNLPWQSEKRQDSTAIGSGHDQEKAAKPT